MSSLSIGARCSCAGGHRGPAGGSIRASGVCGPTPPLSRRPVGPAARVGRAVSRSRPGGAADRLAEGSERILRPEQEQALRAWEEAGCRGVIVMPTGTGKTEVALAAMARARVATLVVAPVREPDAPVASPDPPVTRVRRRDRRRFGLQPSTCHGDDLRRRGTRGCRRWATGSG